MNLRLPITLLLLLLSDLIWAGYFPMANQPDSVFLFSYSTEKDDGRNGLHLAWSTNTQNWESIGPEMRFLFCDYGSWGKEKRLVSPFLIKDQDDTWHCIWSLNEYDGKFAHAESKDLIYWKPQTYPQVIENNNCLMPEVSFVPAEKVYKISWLSNVNGEEKAYFVTTNDFLTYSSKEELPKNERLNSRKKVWINGKSEVGIIHKVSWEFLEVLLNKQQINAYRDQLWAENSKTDSERFAEISSVDVNIQVEGSNSKKISDMLIGVFFEDINYAADGGLYAELVQNRDFEYSPGDKKGRDETWNSYKAWQVEGSDISFLIDTISPIHPNNPHYAILKTEKIGSGLSNEGFDGIAIQAGQQYNFSAFIANPDKRNKNVLVRLVSKNEEILGEASIAVSSASWKKYKANINVKKTCPDSRLAIFPQTEGILHLDMISLFPQNTFKNRPNGLRADLAQTIADIHPRFMRFPGGCVAHGDGIENIYRWKNTIGPLESRKPQRNLWGYHQTAGLGYFEYFQFCEDIGAEPLPVIAAGVPCQNSSTGGAGQQGGIPMCEMDDYVQEVLDLIEWANGDEKSKWGKLRAQAGHPAPFNLKYIGIGNEDLINEIFEERFTMIFNAVKEKHPEITVIGTVGPFFEGTDYTEGWKIATKLGVPMVDEHYYLSPGWFIYNQNFYDKYDRTKSKVYLGEYAAHLPGRPNNLETALAEALYLTAVERNGDIVHMTSYAPMLAKEGHTQWNPDLIYFNNTEIKPTVGYFIQKLFGQNSGDYYLPCSISVSEKNEKVVKRIAASVVRNSKSNDIIVKMVNLLPVEAKTTIDFSKMEEIITTAERIVLTGSPDDKTARPETDQINVNSNTSITLPPYSFTLLRIKTQ